MRVLVACEFSGRVREAFKARGHDAWSCDILPTEIPGQHIQDDVLKHLDEGWDLMIAHPPCTYLTISANKWMKPEFNNRFPNREQHRKKAINFFILLASSNIPKICVENPIGVMSTNFRKPDQIIHPYYFGDNDKKSTCLWLKNLPNLIHVNILPKPEKSYLHHLPPSPERWKIRSRTFIGIAKAMAEQWG